MDGGTRTGNRPRLGRSDLAILAAVVLVVALLLVLALVFNRGSGFDRQIWLLNPDPGGKDNARSKMVGDLLHNYLKPGTTRKQVRQLLGEPDCQSQWDRANNIDGYNLGHIGPFGIDGSVLQIKYDRNGKLASTEAFEM